MINCAINGLDILNLLDFERQVRQLTIRMHRSILLHFAITALRTCSHLLFMFLMPRLFGKVAIISRVCMCQFQKNITSGTFFALRVCNSACLDAFNRLSFDAEIIRI